MRFLAFFFFVLMLPWLSGCVGTGKSVDRARVAELNTRLGVEYLEQGRLDIAKVKLQRALEAQPDSPQVNWANALLYEELGDTERAERFYRKAVREDESAGDAHNSFGAFLCRQGRYKEGVREFEKAVSNRLYPTPHIALTNAGLCYEDAGDEDKAEDYYRQALEKKPDYGTALYRLAVLTQKQKRYLASRAFRERLAAAVGKQNPKVLWLCVVTERAMHNLGEADACEHQLKTQFPASEEASSLY